MNQFLVVVFKIISSIATWYGNDADTFMWVLYDYVCCWQGVHKVEKKNNKNQGKVFLKWKWDDLT